MTRRVKNIGALSLSLGLGLSLSLWAASSLTSPAPARAQEEPPSDAELVERRVRIARLLFDQGEALFSRGDYEGALLQFERVRVHLAGHPARYTVLYNIAQCLERLFRYGRAIESYEAYLREGGGEDEDAPVVRERIEALSGLLARVEIRVNLDDAEVWLDGQLVGSAPGRIRMPMGSHRLEIRAQGYHPVRHRVRLGAHETTRLTVRMRPIEADEGGRVDGAWFWASLAASASSLGLGLALGLGALVQQRALEERFRLGVGVEEGDAQLLDHLKVGADVFYGLAGILGLGALTFGLLTNWGEGRESRGEVIEETGEERELEEAGLRLDRLGLAPSPGGWVLVGGGRF